MAFRKMVQAIKKSTSSATILTLGLDNAGKTTLIMKLFNITGCVSPTFGYQIFTIPWASRHVPEVLPSVASEGDPEQDSGNSESKGGLKELTIVDIGGQTEFKKYWSNYFEDADGVIFVIDSTDARSYKEYLEEVLSLSLPTAIYINKTDLGNLGDLSSFANGVESDLIKIFQSSALSGKGVREGFNWLISHIEKTRGY